MELATFFFESHIPLRTIREGLLSSILEVRPHRAKSVGLLPLTEPMASWATVVLVKTGLHT